MSSITINNNSLIFGNQSPLFKVQSDCEIKEKLTSMLIDRSTISYKKRSLALYMLANNIFDHGVANVNTNIKHAIGKLIEPFITRNIQQIEDIVVKTPRQRYAQGEVLLTSEIAKVTGVKNTLVMISDSERESITACHGIITYLIEDVSNGSGINIEAGWSNGFFTFKNPSKMAILIMIPKQYLASLFMHTVPNTNQNIGTSMDDIVLKGQVVENFANDLIKSFFSAIYNDGIRSGLVNDILLANEIFQKEGELISSMTDTSGDINEASLCLKKHDNYLVQFKSENKPEHLIYELLRMSKYGEITLNPYEFYKGFVDSPYVQIENTFDNIPAINKLTKCYTTYNFSNNLCDMDIFQADKDRDILVQGIKLIKFIPFMLFNTYVLGGGSLHTETKVVMETVKSFVLNVMSYRASNSISAGVAEFIAKNINFIVNDLYPQLASPLSVTNASRKALVIAIDNAEYSEGEK